MGATSSASYANTGASTYLPSGGPGQQAAFSYDGAGNQLTVDNSSATSTSSVAYHADGTLDTSTDPRGNVTDYAKNTDHQLTGITPPSGSSLGGNRGRLRRVRAAAQRPRRPRVAHHLRL